MRLMKCSNDYVFQTPPPAAVEFLTKIREVISVAKHKMSAKRFSPSLMGIPEEDPYAKEKPPAMRSRTSSVTSISRKNSCSGCPDPPPPSMTNYNSAASGACCPTDTKQRIIRKWLEDVPIVQSIENKTNKEIKTESDAVKAELAKRPSPPPPPVRSEIKRPSCKGPAPPRPPPPKPPKLKKEEEPINDIPTFNNLPILTTFKGRNTPEVPPPIPTTNPGPLPTGGSPPIAPSPPPLPKEDDHDSVPRVQGKDKVPPAVAKTLMDAVIKELVVQKKMDPKKPKQVAAQFENDEKIAFESDSLERSKKEVPPEPAKSFRLFEPEYDDQIDSCIDTCEEEPQADIPDVVQQHKPICQDDHDYEMILLNPELAPNLDEKELKIYNLPEILSKNEGYSLVSEVYVNDGYTYSSGESSPNSTSPSSKESLKSNQSNLGRLTIQVKDSPDNYKHIADESDFEPDTLDRKPGKLKIVDTITNWEDCAQEKYSNQTFHGMDMDCQHQNRKNQYISNDTYMDSLERPQIMLKSNSSFRKTSIERHVDELLRTLESPLAKDFSSLREIYEAKSKNQRKRTETTSLVGGSVTSDTDCMSTLSWNEDRRNKLLHRGIVLHMGSGRKPKRSKHHDKNNYPDVVPPRPPKPPALAATPQRSGTTTPAARSYCPSPSNRSVCTSPNRSACTSPPPRTCMSPTRTCPTPPPPPRACSTPPPPPPPRSTPPASPVPKALRTPVPPPPSAQGSPPNRSRNTSNCTSPLPRGCGTSPCVSPSRSMCASPTPLPRSACTSPQPPPRPGPKTQDKSPPLPPRNLKPPLPPKNAKSTRQRKAPTGGNSSNLARRPLPPLPSRSHHDTLSSVSSRDLETLSTLSGASMDSLNSSDYEAFYTLPYDGNEGEIYDKAQEKFQKAQLEKIRQYKNLDSVFSTDEDIYNAINMSSSFREKVKDLRTRNRRPDNRKWRQMGSFIHKPEDSGYLSTDSNESGLRPRLPTVPRIPERAETPSQGSETEGDNDNDGASESGAESTATDSFFFGKFRKDDSNLFRQSFRLSDVEVNSDTERQSIPILVRH